MHNLEAGDYQLEIENNFDSTTYNGQKAVILSTSSTFGAKKTAPAIMFLLVGCFLLVMSIIFLVLYSKKKKIE